MKNCRAACAGPRPAHAASAVISRPSTWPRVRVAASSAVLRVGADLGHARGRRRLLAFQATQRARAGAQHPFREPVRLPEPGADVPAEGARGSGRAGSHPGCHPGGFAGARGEWRSRVPAVHQSPRTARGRRRTAARLGRDAAGAGADPGHRVARSAAARVSRGRQRRAARHRQFLGGRRRQGHGAVGRRSSTSCRLRRRTIRCSRRALQPSASKAAIRSSTSRCRRR